MDILALVLVLVSLSGDRSITTEVIFGHLPDDQCRVVRDSAPSRIVEIAGGEYVAAYACVKQDDPAAAPAELRV